jgi:antitoxin component YwqK of YwqJK toxin-antitoxin module
VTGFYESGKKMAEGAFKNGKEDGMMTEWYENGRKKSEAVYKEGQLIGQKQWDEAGNATE